MSPLRVISCTEDDEGTVRVKAVRDERAVTLGDRLTGVVEATWLCSKDEQPRIGAVAQVEISSISWSS